VAIQSADIVLVRSDPRDVVTIVELCARHVPQDGPEPLLGDRLQRGGHTPHGGALYAQGVVLSPAVGAMLMSLSTVIVAVNARLLRLPSA
jgi:Cu2+-exporting ATPase